MPRRLLLLLLACALGGLAPPGVAWAGASSEVSVDPGVPAPDEAPGAASASEPGAESASEPGAESASEPAGEAVTAPAVRPPRVDGPYVGGMAYAPATFVRVRDLDTAGLFPGFGGSVRAGEAVLRWLTIGVEITGSLAYRGDQRLGQGALLVEFGLLPAPRLPLSLRAGFGVGGGAVRERGVPGRSGFGGAVFKAAARYDLFPWAARRRPRRGGGFGLGPEIGWIGFTPAAAGRPMSNTIYVGLGAGFYFGS